MLKSILKITASLLSVGISAQSWGAAHELPRPTVEAMLTDAGVAAIWDTQQDFGGDDETQRDIWGYSTPRQLSKNLCASAVTHLVVQSVGPGFKILRKENSTSVALRDCRGLQLGDLKPVDGVPDDALIGVAEDIVSVIKSKSDVNRDLKVHFESELAKTYVRTVKLDDLAAITKIKTTGTRVYFTLSLGKNLVFDSSQNGEERTLNISANDREPDCTGPHGPEQCGK